ncbi:hypothetical protein GH741_16065 [Aquibacillus halophilus]|uniref:Uncharacterized protein n=1 Tax=Aquibacillus halophilus TaxID=930132 RepID=A0A6A8DEN4_9BACI|nr:hypothetical protein [Aquibacillus halophilus]MRH44158.1 hypothetical protein [Aquibacillus halophilus]
MSLIEVNYWEIIKKQYFFKLKAYSGVFTSMMVVQIIAFLLSLGGTGGSGGSGSSGFSYTTGYYNGSMIIAFTMMWALITGILITTKAYRNDDFTFVANRGTSNLSNMLFLLTASIIGGTLSMLSGYLLKVFVYLIFEVDMLFDVTHTISTLWLGIIASILYILLFSAIGYLVGVLAQISKSLIIILAAVVIGYPIYASTGTGQRDEPTLFIAITQFYQGESMLSLFALKVILTVTILFFTSLIITNRLEVKQ